VPPGSAISFFGVFPADVKLANMVQPTLSDDPIPIPIYERPLGSGFTIVIEGRPGGDGTTVGNSAFRYDPGDPNVRPDLQIVVNRDLGNPTAEVCDNQFPSNFGGVPGVAATNFPVTQMVSNAMNDLACRFVDGQGDPVGRPGASSCVEHPDGEFRLVNGASRVQFCWTVPAGVSFPLGDTLVTFRLQDIAGRAGPAAQFILRSLS
jgi:hypothetical protein